MVRSFYRSEAVGFWLVDNCGYSYGVGYEAHVDRQTVVSRLATVNLRMVNKEDLILNREDHTATFKLKQMTSTIHVRL